MKCHMSKKVKPLILLAIIVVVTLFAIFWATTYQPQTPLTKLLERRRDIGDMGRIAPADIELFYTIKTVISTINATLLVFLVFTYIGIYRKIKSDFTIGLIVFSITLLLYALSSNPIVHWIFGFRAFGLGPFAMLPDLFTFGALSILLYLTFKY